MKNLIIIAAGGLGRTLCGMAESCLGYETDFVVKGFIDDDLDALNYFDNYPPIIGKISENISGLNNLKCKLAGINLRNTIKFLLHRAMFYVMFE